MKADPLKDALVHARTIHFALIVVSVTSLYAARLGWSGVHRIDSELTELSAVATALESIDEDPSRVAEQFSDWASDRMRETVAELSSQLGCEIQWRATVPILDDPVQYWGAYSVLDASAPSFRGTASLRDVRRAIIGAHWVLGCPSGIRLTAPLGEKHSSEKTLYLSGVSREPGSSTGQVHLDRKYFVRNSSTPQYATERVPCEFGLHEDVLTYSDARFERQFPGLTSTWGLMSDCTFEGAQSVVEDLKGEGVRGQWFEFLGLRMNGADIGLGGPVIMILLLAYLVCHVSEATRFLSQQGAPGVTGSMCVPWIGVMPGWLPSIVSFTSVVVLPAVACAVVALSFIVSSLRIPIAVVGSGIFVCCGLAIWMKLGELKEAVRQCGKPANP